MRAKTRRIAALFTVVLVLLISASVALGVVAAQPENYPDFERYRPQLVTGSISAALAAAALAGSWCGIALGRYYAAIQSTAQARRELYLSFVASAHAASRAVGRVQKASAEDGSAEDGAAAEAVAAEAHESFESALSALTSDLARLELLSTPELHSAAREVAEVARGCMATIDGESHATATEPGRCTVNDDAHVRHIEDKVTAFLTAARKDITVS